MPIKYSHEFRNSHICRKISKHIQTISKKKINIMEVCGTHTVSIFRHGIRTVLPDTISLISGPGCPVCVTSQKEIDSFIALSEIENSIIATFGDLMKVPGTRSSLQNEKSKGRDIRIVYSPGDALSIAKNNPDKKVIFPGVGFETTTPIIAATIESARNMNLNNYYVFSAHKRVIPALNALVEDTEAHIDGFLLPGHVSAVIGEKPYRKFIKDYNIPCAIAGFEPADILYALYSLIKRIEKKESILDNTYKRVVTGNGNIQAKKILNTVFEQSLAEWRGIGAINNSGYKIKSEYADFDAETSFQIKIKNSKEPEGCSCGDVLKGIIPPPGCRLYKIKCNPDNPVGPCMVSSEGTCAAYFRYDSN